MAVRVEFNEALRQKLGGAEGLDVAAVTVHAALIEVAKMYPALHMFNCDGELRGTLKAKRGGAPVPVSETLADGDRIELAMG